MKIVSVVGRKNTGKTSLTVKIIEELTRRGYNVASIKHSHHEMEMDREHAIPGDISWQDQMLLWESGLHHFLMRYFRTKQITVFN